MFTIFFRFEMANFVAADRNGAEFLFYRNQLVSTACRLCIIFEETGTIGAKFRELTACTIDGRVTWAILALVFDCSDLFLREIVDKVYEYIGVKVSPSAVCSIIYKNGLIRKKV